MNVEAIQSIVTLLYPTKALRFRVSGSATSKATNVSGSRPSLGWVCLRHSKAAKIDPNWMVTAFFAVGQAFSCFPVCRGAPKGRAKYKTMHLSMQSGNDFARVWSATSLRHND